MQNEYNVVSKISFDYVFSSDLQMSVNRDSNKLLVTGLPDSVDEDHLEMFFEHTKRQGGGPVKCVQLYPDKRQAIVEFEETEAVQRVLNKQPIKMLGTTVNVEQYEPYLDKDETLKCIEIGGIQAELVKEIAEMKLKHNDNDTNVPTMPALQMSCKIFPDDSDENDLFSPVKVHPPHFGIVCDGCEGPICGIRYKCRRCFDFYFCASCKNTIYHNPKHKFIEIKPF